jgi:hypothetical protein
MQEDKEKKTVQIFVNTVAKEEPQGKITFARLVELAFGEGADQNAGYKITYENGHGQAEPKDLPVGADVQIHKGMIFNVSATVFS